MSLNKSVIKIRVELQKSGIKKSGKNKFAGFGYYELSDFLPTLNTLMFEEGVNDVFSIDENFASLTLIKDDAQQIYKIPFIMFDVPLSKNGQKSMQQIQYLGALITYYKRYLYLSAFGITDGEVIDAMNNADTMDNSEKPLDNGQVSQIKELIKQSSTDENKFLAYFKVNSINKLPYDKAIQALNNKIKKAS